VLPALGMGLHRRRNRGLHGILPFGQDNLELPGRPRARRGGPCIPHRTPLVVATRVTRDDSPFVVVTLAGLWYLRARNVAMNSGSNHSTPEDFALMYGGPFFRLKQKLGLEHPEHPLRDPTIQALLTWSVAWASLLFLSRLQGNTHEFLAARSVHAEILSGLTALIAGERYVDGRIATAARQPLVLGLLPAPDLSRYRATLKHAADLRDRGLPELVLLVLGYGMSLTQLQLGLEPRFAFRQGTFTPAGLWYAAVSKPLFWFVLLRWVWRFGIWCDVLVRLSRLNLRLTPTHADKTGGLQYLARCQASFSVAVFAVGCLVSSLTRGDSVALEGGPASYARVQVQFTVIALMILNLPLLFFSRKLLDAKRLADERFSALMARHAREFERKWFGHPLGTHPLGNQEMSSQIDISSAFEQASKMRWLPFGFRPFLGIVISALFLPLVARLVANRQLLEAVLLFVPGMR
jgi:hypothetical protein